MDAATGEVIAEAKRVALLHARFKRQALHHGDSTRALGTELSFRDRGAHQWPVVAGEALVDELELIGGGDPNLSGPGFAVPSGRKDGDCLAGLNKLADKLAAAGVREVAGDVVGVATRYPDDFYPDGLDR